jgi:23S rRNA (uracil1939-C5)-methyltransferase
LKAEEIMSKQRTKKSNPRRQRRKPPVETMEVTVERLNDDGIGVGRHATKEVLIAGALPGEKAVIAVEHEGQHRIVGQLRRLLSKNPARRASPCPYLRDCQGCSLMSMSYADQLQFKRDKVRAALSAYPPLKNIEVAPVRAADAPLGYRTSAKLTLARRRGRILIGLYRRGSHEVVDIGNCPLHHPLINRIIDVVRDEIARQDIYLYNPVTRRGLLRYLLIKVSPANGKAMVTFVTAQREYKRITALAKWVARKVPEIVSIQQNVNASAGNVILGRETLRMIGQPDLFDQVGDIRLRISPTSFFQVNHEQAARIYNLIRQWAGLRNNEYALDLYCGIGGIALHLAQDAGQVVGIEMVEEAVRNAQQNAAMNNLTNCRFLAGDASELLQDLITTLPALAAAVLNPPRSGCDSEVLQAVIRLQPRTLIYVSCNPETLARDLAELYRMGYRTAEIRPVDMFPQTAHVESVARLVRMSKAGD